MWAKKIQIEGIVMGGGDTEREMDWSEDIVYEKIARMLSFLLWYSKKE